MKLQFAIHSFIAVALLIANGFPTHLSLTPPMLPWSEIKKLIASDGAAVDNFGFSVAVEGDTAVTGALWDDLGSNEEQGSAYVFYRHQEGTDNWGQIRKLVASDGAAEDHFGLSVSVDGDVIVIGSPASDVGDHREQGAVYVFYRHQGGIDNWGQVKKLTLPDGAAGDWFGESVAISGDTLVVGSSSHDVGSYNGAACIFYRHQGGTDNWGLVKKLTASVTQSGDFGRAVAIDGDTVLVGAMSEDLASNYDQGSAYVFSRHQGGTDNWGQVKKLTASDGATYDHFGASVDIAGDTLVIGADGDDVGSNNAQGSAYIFLRDQGGTDNWGQVKKLVASDGAAEDGLGSSVAVSGDTVMIGAEEDDVGSNSDQGSVYVFYRYEGGTDGWGQVSKLLASDAVAGDSFGNAVAIDGETAVIGAHFVDVDGNVSQGSAYIFGQIPPKVQFSSALYSAGENAGTATIQVTLSTGSALTATVNYATVAGSATAGSDYTPVSGTLTFAPGQTARSFDVAIANDLLDENDETLTLTLSDPSEATLGSPASATLTLVDDDFAVSGVTISGPSSGAANTLHTFSAAVSPVSATPPITYTWSPTPASGQGTASAGYTWTSAGAMTVSVSAVNASGAAGDEHVFTVLAPEMTLDPAELGATLNPGEALTRTLEIGNAGDFALTWSLTEEPAAAWLRALPASGTEPPGSTRNVAVAFDAGGLGLGHYTTTLRLTSNDLDRPQVDVTAALVVTNVCIAVSGVDFTYDPLDPETDQAITFRAEVAGGSGPISFTWDFDDGALGQGTVVSHTYRQAQTFGVRLAAANSCPSQDSTQKDVDVRQALTLVYLPLVLRRYPPIPDVPTLNPVDNADADGSYTVSWSNAGLAQAYVLEEAADSTFSGAQQVYSGPNTAYVVSGRGAARYYYRVKARNSWGDSGWSAVEQVDVLWEREPNDDALTQANGPLVSSLIYRGTFPGTAAVDPKDYFYVDLPAAGSIEVWLWNVPAGCDYDLTLRDANLALVQHSGQPDNSDEHVLTGVPAPGRYYIQVSNRSGPGSAQPYLLEIVYP